MHGAVDHERNLEKCLNKIEREKVYFEIIF